jgi:hypothetical protein
MVTFCVAVLPQSPAKAATPPNGFIQAWADEKTAGLQFSSDRPVRFSLTLPDGRDWSGVNIAQFAVRTWKRQESLVDRARAATAAVEQTFDRSGWALVAVSVGPREATHRSDAVSQVTHCAKLVLNIVDPPEKSQERERQYKNPGLTAKVGQRFEIVPLISPPALKIGGDLPVRAYFDYDKGVELPVTAVAPDGTIQEAVTDSVGVAHFPMTQAGRWLIRFEKPLDGSQRFAELVFEVLDRP